MDERIQSADRGNKMKWETVQKMAERASDGASIFVRLKNDGDKITGVFCGEPHAREVCWDGTKYATYDREVHRDLKPTLKIMLNFFDVSDKKMKIVEGGARWFASICKVREKYGTSSWSFEIQRHGAAGDTGTTYTVLPDDKLEPDMRALVESTPVHDLEALAAAAVSSSNGLKEDVPF